MSIKLLKNLQIKPNLEKDENYENNNSYILKGQRVYNPKRNYGCLNELYFKREEEEAKKELNKTFAEVLDDEVKAYVVDIEDDEYEIRDTQLLNVYCSIGERYRNHRKFYRKQLIKSQEILQLIELTKTFKYIKGASNSQLIVFDLQRGNGEWEE